MGEEAVALLVFGIVLERVVIVSSSLAWSAWHDRVFFLLHTSDSLYHYCYSYYYVSVQLSQFPSFSPSQKETLRARCQTFAFGSTLRRTLAGLPRRTEWLVNVELTLAVPDPTP